MSKRSIQILFMLGALIILLLSIYNLSVIAGQTSDENWYRDQEEGVVIFIVTPGGVSEAAGLEVSDRLVMINGDSISTARHAQSYLNNAQPGESLIYTIERDGRVFDVKVNLALAGLRIFVVGSLSAGIVFLLYAIFLIFIKPQDKYARLMAIASMLFAFFYMNLQQAANIPNQPLEYQLSMLILIAIFFLTVAFFAHSMLYFPVRKYKTINRFWMIYMHYIIAGIMITYCWYEAISTYAFRQNHMMVPLLYLVGVEIANWKKRKREYIVRIKVIKFTVLIIILISLIAGVIAFWLDLRLESGLEYLSFLAFLVPLSVLYTTIRYRVFDISVRIKLSLVYAVIQTLLLVGFVLSLIFVIRFLPLWEIDIPGIYLTGSSLEIRSTDQLDPTTQKQIQMGYLLLFGITITLVLYLFKNRLQKFIDKLFFQQKYDYRNALKRFGELLSSYFDREDISHKSIEQIHEILKVKGTSLAVSNNGLLQVTSAKGNLESLNSQQLVFPDTLINTIIDSKMQLKQEDFKNISKLSQVEDLIYCGTPVFSGKNNLEAILFTGEKLSESAYNHDDLELLRLFAENLGTAFERARLYEEMAEKERLEREMEIAREIQLNSLPRCDPDYSGLQICSALAPATEVGGDYYDYLEIDDHSLGIIVGDVVGKGTYGAIHMSKIQGFVQILQQENLPPKKMFERLNTLIRKNFDPEFFFTALYGLFEINSNKLNIYRLGHNGLFYYNASTAKINIIEPEGIGFGIAATEKFVKQMKPDTISYNKNDIFVFLTDGFLEAMDSDNQPFGEERICQIITSSADQDATAIMDTLRESVRNFSGGVQNDDATGVIVKII
jgi:serine phosphatase RsbU (regulator of sigma subunit)